MPIPMKAPFATFDLISGAEKLEGIENLFPFEFMRSSYVVDVARTVVRDYEDWDWDQSFGHSDMTYAIQLFLDRVIRQFRLDCKTEFSPNLKVVKL